MYNIKDLLIFKLGKKNKVINLTDPRTYLANRIRFCFFLWYCVGAGSRLLGKNFRVLSFFFFWLEKASNSLARLAAD